MDDPLSELRQRLAVERGYYAQQTGEKLEGMDASTPMTKEQALYSTALAILPALVGAAIKGRRGASAGIQASGIGVGSLFKDMAEHDKRMEELSGLEYKTALGQYKDADKRIKDIDLINAKYAPGGPLLRYAQTRATGLQPTLGDVLAGDSNPPPALGEGFTIKRDNEPSVEQLDALAQDDLGVKYSDMSPSDQKLFKEQVLAAAKTATPASPLAPKEFVGSGEDTSQEGATGKATEVPTDTEALRAAAQTLQMPPIDIERLAQTAPTKQIKEIVQLATAIKEYNAMGKKPLTMDQLTLLSNGLKLEAEFQKLLVLAQKLGPDTKLPGILKNYKGLESAVKGGAAGNVDLLGIQTSPGFEAGSPEAAFYRRLQRLATVLAATEQGKRLSDLDQRVYDRYIGYARAENMGKQDWINHLSELYQDAKANRGVIIDLMNAKSGGIDAAIGLRKDESAIPAAGMDLSPIPPELKSSSGWVLVETVGPNGETIPDYVSKEEALKMVGGTS